MLLRCGGGAIGLAGGPGNPLGARALYLGHTLYRIHGTNQPSTIGHDVSSGCVGMLNEDVEDLYSRVRIGAKVIVLPQSAPMQAVRHAPRPERDARVSFNRRGTTGIY